MNNYTAAQVLEKIPGLTARTLIDMSENGIITPKEDTTGTGSPRKYDDENLFQIAVAFNLRKVMPRAALKQFMKVDFHETQGQDFLSINFWCNEKDNWQYAATGLKLAEIGGIGILLKETKKTFFVGPLTIILDLHQIRNNLSL